MITQSEVSEFKTLYCNENRIISELLKNRLSQFFIEPILDVGSGFGDITAAAFSNLTVIHLDILDYSDHRLPSAHKRITRDFFDFSAADSGQIGTLLMCHVLQFLDEDRAQLDQKICLLSPMYIVTVTNCNDAYMQKLLTWVMTNFEFTNPEVELAGFPEGYILDEEVQFAATVRCKDYSMLTDQVIYLMDALPSASERDQLEDRLRQDLLAPTLEIHQSIKVYEKYEQQSFQPF
jgi:hypothetical protein